MPSSISGSQIATANLLLGGTYLADTISTIENKVSNNYLQAQGYGTGDVSNNYLQTAFSSGYRAGELIETITGNCRGEVVEVLSGTYTLQNVTSAMNGSSTYTAITGSTLNYTPPSGTKRVLYRFDYKFDVTENSGISHHVLYIDGVKVDPTTTTISSNFASQNWHHANFMVPFSFVIQCDADADNASEGQFTSWTSSKELKVMYREYSGSYESSIHSNVWWNGTGASGTDNFRSPTLTIQAYA